MTDPDTAGADPLVTIVAEALRKAAVNGRIPSTREPLPFLSLADIAVAAVRAHQNTTGQQTAAQVLLAKRESDCRRYGRDASFVAVEYVDALSDAGFIVFTAEEVAGAAAQALRDAADALPLPEDNWPEAPHNCRTHDLDVADWLRTRADTLELS